MGWWPFGRKAQTYAVIGYDLRGREDDVRLAVSKARKMLFNLKFMIVDFVWREAKPASECLGDETREFLSSGGLQGKLDVDRHQSLVHIASDFAARLWSRDKARDAMLDAVRRHRLPSDLIAVVNRIVLQAYREPPVLGRCTQPGRFRVVDAHLCYGHGDHKIVTNAVSKAGQTVLVPPSFRLSEELTIAVQREIDDPKRNEYVQSVLEKQVSENRKTVNLLQGRKQFLHYHER